MDDIPIWAWWVVITGGVLLSPVLAFLGAVAIEIVVGVVKDGGVPSLVILVAAGVIARLVLRKCWARRRGSRFVHDQA